MVEFLVERGSWKLRVDISERRREELRLALSPHFSCSELRSRPSGAAGESEPLLLSVGGVRPSGRNETWQWSTPDWSVVLEPGTGVFLEGDSVEHSARMVRELYRASGSAAGMLLQLHGSAATDGRGAILVLGHKRAGKTSLVLTLLGLGFDYLANDDAMVTRRSGRLVVEGTGRRINVRKGTEDLIPPWPELQALLGGRASQHADGRRSLTTEDLQSLGVGLAESDNLRMVVHPALGPGPLAWSRVESPAAREGMLTANTLIPPSALNAFLLGLLGPWELGGLRHLAMEAERVPTFRLTGSLVVPGAQAELAELLNTEEG